MNELSEYMAMNIISCKCAYCAYIEQRGHLSAHALKGECVEHTNREIFVGFLNRIVVIGKTCIRSEITTRNLVFFLVLANFFIP